MGKAIVFTDEQLSWFKANFATASLIDIRTHMQCSNATIYRLGRELGLERPRADPSKINLSERQEKWLVAHFKHTKNVEIAQHLGISESTLHRMARELGLTKSKPFMKKCQAEAQDAAYRSNLINGRFPPKGYIIPGSERHRFKKGVTSEQRLGKRRNRLRIEKYTASMKELRKKEHARVTFGLPQKTNLRIVRQPREKTLLRYALKKHGYLIDEEERIAFYDGQTKRSEKLESREQRWYTFEPYDFN